MRRLGLRRRREGAPAGGRGGGVEAEGAAPGLARRGRLAAAPAAVRGRRRRRARRRRHLGWRIGRRKRTGSTLCRCDRASCEEFVYVAIFARWHRKCTTKGGYIGVNYDDCDCS